MLCVFRFFAKMMLLLFVGAFFSTCGLESVVTVEAPTVTYNDPLFSSSDYANQYFSFLTAEDSGNDFMGTEVYYKIYNNSSTLVSERNAILSVNSASNNTAAATRMIETYTYQTLGTNPSSNRTIFVDSPSANQIIIRLKSYTGQENHLGDDWYSFRSGIDGYIYNYTDFTPFRNGGTKSFDFFDDNDDDSGYTRDVKPEEGDSDYKHSSSATESDTYYVQMFAVGVAYDQSTLSNTYSLVLNLGSVAIQKGK